MHNCVCHGPAYTTTTTVKMTTATMSTTISTTTIHVSGELDPSVGSGSASIVTVLKHRKKGIEKLASQLVLHIHNVCESMVCVCVLLWLVCSSTIQ